MLCLLGPTMVVALSSAHWNGWPHALGHGRRLCPWGHVQGHGLLKLRGWLHFETQEETTLPSGPVSLGLCRQWQSWWSLNYLQGHFSLFLKDKTYLQPIQSRTVPIRPKPVFSILTLLESPCFIVCLSFYRIHRIKSCEKYWVQNFSKGKNHASEQDRKIKGEMAKESGAPLSIIYIFLKNWNKV